MGIAQTTQTITGVVLIAVQSVLTGVLAILIAVNAVIICCKENPHRKRRKEAEKLNRDLDNLTPLDARNSLLLPPGKRASATVSEKPLLPEPTIPILSEAGKLNNYAGQSVNPYTNGYEYRRPAVPFQPRPPQSREGLIPGAAPFAGTSSLQQQPTLPMYFKGYDGRGGRAY